MFCPKIINNKDRLLKVNPKYFNFEDENLIFKITFSYKIKLCIPVP